MIAPAAPHSMAAAPLPPGPLPAAAAGDGFAALLLIGQGAAPPPMPSAGGPAPQPTPGSGAPPLPDLVAPDVVGEAPVAPDMRGLPPAVPRAVPRELRGADAGTPMAVALGNEASDGTIAEKAGEGIDPGVAPSPEIVGPPLPVEIPFVPAAAALPVETVRRAAEAATSTPAVVELAEPAGHRGTMPFAHAARAVPTVREDEGERMPVAAVEAIAGPPAPSLAFATAPPVGSAVSSVPVTVAPTAAVPLEVAPDGQWIDRLAAEIGAMAGGGSARFALMPDHLGHILVEVRQGESGASVAITAEAEAGRALLAGAQDRLAADARAQGVRIAGVEIGGSGPSAQGGGAEQRQVPAPTVPQPFAPKRGEIAETANHERAIRSGRWA